VVTGIASATVTDLGTSAAESAAESPSNFPANAVVNMAKTEVEMRQPKISTACRAMMRLASNTLNAKLRMTLPRKVIKRSPAPRSEMDSNPNGTPVR